MKRLKQSDEEIIVSCDLLPASILISSWTFVPLARVSLLVELIFALECKRNWDRITKHTTNVNKY